MTTSKLLLFREIREELELCKKQGYQCVYLAYDGIKLEVREQTCGKYGKFVIVARYEDGSVLRLQSDNLYRIVDCF